MQNRRLFPDSRHHQFKTGDGAGALDGGGLGKVFGLVARSVDGNGLLDGVNEPGDFCSVGDPLGHFGAKIGDFVAGRAEFDDEIGAEGRETALVLIREGMPALI